jgi:hypothetical protein
MIETKLPAQRSGGGEIPGQAVVTDAIITQLGQGNVTDVLRLRYITRIVRSSSSQ